MKRAERERYEREEYGRSDPRRRQEPADDRHGRARVEPRERREREIVDDRMDMRSARGESKRSYGTPLWTPGYRLPVWTPEEILEQTPEQTLVPVCNLLGTSMESKLEPEENLSSTKTRGQASFVMQPQENYTSKLLVLNEAMMTTTGWTKMIFLS